MLWHYEIVKSKSTFSNADNIRKGIVTSKFNFNLNKSRLRTQTKLKGIRYAFESIRYVYSKGQWQVRMGLLYSLEYIMIEIFLYLFDC